MREEDLHDTANARHKSLPKRDSRNRGERPWHALRLAGGSRNACSLVPMEAHRSVCHADPGDACRVLQP
jgi:hypothetical protein